MNKLEDEEIEKTDDNYCNWCFKYEDLKKCPQRKNWYGFNKPIEEIKTYPPRIPKDLGEDND